MTPTLAQANPMSIFGVYGSASRQETRSFEYFVSQVIPGFTRIVDDSFWHQTILQLSHSESLIWHAVIAMSCLIQYPQYSTAPVIPASPRAPTAISNEHHRRALTWYGWSIAGLRDRLTLEKSRSAVAVIACMLYVCIECLQDHVIEAVVLYRHAVGMVGLAPPNNHEQSSMAKTETEIEIDHKIRAILRHETMSHGLSVPRPKLTLDSTSGSFHASSAAREELYALITECQVFIQNVGRIKDMHGKDWLPSSDLIQQQESHQADLFRWHVAFSNTPSSLGAIRSPDELELRSVLFIAYAQYFIWLSVCLSTLETAFDSFFPSFESIVQHAERVIASKRPENRPVFILESRVIPSLYFVAIKCRHPWIRRRALLLLRSGPKVENIWKSEPMALVAEKSIEVEESGAIHAEHLQAQSSAWAQTSPADHLPPECDRLYQQEVVNTKDTNGRATHGLVLCGWRQEKDLRWSRTSLSLTLDFL
ncbi:uncharacterized protein A1O9_10487 [Exophiala aquamarina CBS 119918]|uniref:Transcription factor domain-containing protein n=1 Tax=Exophiala aquamarina CBS 119918 TaxID=1182545 RepID=A0A072P1F4_9EURO|nr:uncharacterized protein A1O9_10487 [Exophiala aquamarina CBS 119918]KEF53512.1 hypothetical protein A1O9_10487 [Exophiala aquamarina CBS 119918]